MPGVRECCNSISPQPHETDCGAYGTHNHAYGKSACPHPNCATADTPKYSEVFYKIRHPDGRFSDGGYVPGFSKRGKVWRSLGALRNHLNKVEPHTVSTPRYAGCQVIRFETIETEKLSVETELTACKDRRIAREQQRIARAKKAHQRSEIEQLKKLKEKYPDV